VEEAQEMITKTYKRELAIGLLVWLGYVVETKDAEIVNILVWPIFTFAAAAFGFDQYRRMQQPSLEPLDRGRSERSSEHTVGPTEYPDGR
jgi:hypothetical protein